MFMIKRQEQNGEQMNILKNIKTDIAMIKKALIIADLFALIVAVAMISACHNALSALGQMEDASVPRCEKSEIRVYKGDSLMPGLLNTEDCLVIWESENEGVAVVQEDGTVTGLAEGSTAINALVINEQTSDRTKLTMTVEVLRKEVPSDSDLPYWYEDEIFLINGKNPVGEDYKPELKDVRKSIPTAHNETKLTPACEEALAKMYSDFLKQDLGELRLISTYRSVAKQKELLDKAIKQRMKDYGMTEKEARESALKTRMEPGYSEHHSGLAIDFSTVYTTQNKFHETKQGKWLTENAHKYGFVLRYPKDKVSITGINYEPWHFRFIESEHAVEHATYIYEHGLCLEEYVDLQAQAKAAAEEYARNNPLE